LWIDSLCIIQDSPSDWSAEAKAMDRVYVNSYCTIAASSSPNSGGGCKRRFQRTGTTHAPRYIDIEKGQYFIRMFERTPLDWNEELKQGPLMTRAWTLQERELSLRIVHFCENLLLGVCRTMRASSELPWFQMKIEDPPASLLLNSAADLAGNGESIKRREYWFQIVEDYSSRKLTEATDKLPALAGLAQRENELRQSQYLAGLWQDDLPSALLWRSSHFVPRVGARGIQPSDPLGGHHGPSWSWIAVSGVVSYESQRSSQPSLLDITTRQSEFVFPDFQAINTIMDEDSCERVDAGPVGHMFVRGQLKPTFIDLMKSERSGYNEYHLIRMLDGSKAGIIYLDAMASSGEKQPVYCLRIRDEVNHSRIGVPYGLYDHLSEDGERPNSTHLANKN